MCDSLEERTHFESVVNSVRSYKVYALADVSRSERYFESLSMRHKTLMTDYRSQLRRMKECIMENDALITKVLDFGRMFHNVDLQSADHANPLPIHIRDMGADLPRIESVFKHIYRDWSAEGAEERQMCYGPLIDQLLKLYPSPDDRDGVNVLVPGAGLGRLVFEIAKLGFECQGNEFSLFMMFFSQFILNRCDTVGQHKVFPWVHQVVNVMSNDDQIAAVQFPDISPKLITEFPGARISMAAGDFLEVYRKPNSWECIITCFFIDCAHNIAEFIQAIYFILKPGGHWLNLGPLLYHYSNSPTEDSIEPSYEVVHQLLEGFGFIIKEEKPMRTKYCQNPNSMMRFSYDSIFFHCMKPLSLIDDETGVSSTN